jgi:two-component system, NtrC family, sensor kinase
MIHPQSRLVLYTVLLATVLFACGLYIHINQINLERREYYTNVNRSIQFKLADYLLSQKADVNPDLSLTGNHSGKQDFSTCNFLIISDSLTITSDGNEQLSNSILRKLIIEFINIEVHSTDTIFYVVQYIGNVAHFASYQFYRDGFQNLRGRLSICLMPVPRVLDQLINPFCGPIASAIKYDTLILSSKAISSAEIQKQLLNDLSDDVKFVAMVRGKKKQHFTRVITELNPPLQLISFFSVDKKFMLSTFLFIAAYIILLIATILFPKLFRKDLQKQISEINQVVEFISDKDFDRRISTEYPGELGQLTRSINRMSTQLKEVYHDLEIRVIRRTSEISMRNAELRKTQREILKQNNELKSAYEALKESREKYEKLIEHLEDEYFFYSKAANGTLLFVSPSVKKILGFSVNRYRNLHNQLFTDNPLNAIARECIENIQKGLSQPKYLKEIFDVNNQPKILEVSEVPVFNEENQLVSIEGLAHDITERQKAEEVIKEQEEKYRMLFTYASDFIFMYELDKKKKKVAQFIEANQYTLEKLGYPIEELREKTPLDLIAAEMWDNTTEVLAEYDADDCKFERIWESKDGNLIDVEISTHAFKIKNKTVAIAVARDISDRKRAEEEIRFVNEELINQKENLEALVDNLTQTQEQLVQSEKMAALGQLIAGIAHEINTPLGAIKASIGNLSDSLDNALGELPALFQTQSAENLSLITQIFNLSRHKKPELSSREKRQKKRELSSFLTENKIQQSEILADLLIYLEIYEIDDLLLASLKLPDALKVFKSASNFISLLRNTNTINIAVEKATKVVFALKKYAHRDSAGEKVSTDIIDSIETVLTLYNNQLKQGVEVIRNYDKLPHVKCYQDEISQVWTNLIQNAIQAMRQEGTLTITARIDKELIWVYFKDSGPGIDPDIKDKIFDPFFTTKKQGEGSGLGLDIVRKIIEKHNWSIEVDSKLGEGATFIIKIPIA